MKGQLVYTQNTFLILTCLTCKFTCNENRKTQIRLTPKSSRRNHAKFFRASLLLLSMENCRKSPQCNLAVTWLNELDKC